MKQIRNSEYVLQVLLVLGGRKQVAADKGFSMCAISWRKRPTN